MKLLAFKYWFMGSILLILVTSCNNYNCVIENSYDSTNLININVYYSRNCEINGLFNMKCDSILSDSLYNSFYRAVKKKELNLSFSGNPKRIEIDSLWNRKNRTHKFNRISEVDTNFLKSQISNSNLLELIPIINYTETYSGSLHGRNYTISISLFLFLIKDDEIIYSSDEWVREETFFIGTFKDFDKSTVEVEHLWKELVDKAMQPYIERLK